MSDTDPHLLVVDDDMRLRELLRRYLSDSGFRVTGAADAAEARAQLASFAFDLVVLDVMMPKMDGLEVCRRLRARSTVPIIMLTAKAEEIDRVLGLELGADDYITKPFGLRELLARIRVQLRRTPKRDSEALARYQFDGVEIEDRRVGASAVGAP